MAKELIGFRNVFLPFCLQRQTDGSYVVGNRRYNPVGITRTDPVDAAQYPVRVQFKDGLTDDLVRQISFNSSGDMDCIRLYDEASTPTTSDENWAAYCARLKVLAHLRVDKPAGEVG